MAVKESAQELLALGLAPSQVANTLGVTESYISQLMANEDFAAEVQAHRVEASQKNLKYDARLNKIEEGFLNRIEEKLPMANLGQSLQAFRVLNNAKRRKESEQTQHGSQISQVVHITLPATMIPQFIKNANNEIIEVEGQTMISATPKGLENILAKRTQAALPAPTNEEVLATHLKLTGLERARETLDAVRPVKQVSRAVPKHLDLEAL
jgi:transcriptional regulator with XRE-family HTH domain